MRRIGSTGVYLKLPVNVPDTCEVNEPLYFIILPYILNFLGGLGCVKVLKGKQYLCLKYLEDLV